MTNTLAYKAAAKVVEDFNAKLSPEALSSAPQESVTIRAKPVVDVTLHLTNPFSLKSQDQLSKLSTPDLEVELYSFISDLEDGGVKIDFVPAYGLAPTESNRRRVYLQVFEHIRAIFFSPRKDVTKLGL